jgi:hypothetical protein
LLPIYGEEHLEAAPLQSPAEHVTIHLIVLDQQDPRHHPPPYAALPRQVVIRSATSCIVGRLTKIMMPKTAAEQQAIDFT